VAQAPQPDAGIVPSSGSRTSLTEPLLMAGVAAASVAVVGLVYPRYPELFPTCPSLTLFGVYCPLCGGTRGAHALTTGRLREAVGYNALLPGLIVLTAWSWVAWVARSLGRDRLPSVPRWLWKSFALVAVVYGVLRNVPVEPFVSWAP